jgi:hypothetical protein
MCENIVAATAVICDILVMPNFVELRFSWPVKLMTMPRNLLKTMKIWTRCQFRLIYGIQSSKLVGT